VSERGKLFQNGGSQAVRLPASCRFPDDLREVSVTRIGRKVVIEPVDDWSEEFRRTLGSWDKPIERPKSEELDSLEDPFTK